jgi:hypothetical protein
VALAVATETQKIDFLKFGNAFDQKAKGIPPKPNGEWTNDESMANDSTR